MIALSTRDAERLSGCCKAKIPVTVLRHIFEKHHDLVEYLGVTAPSELADVLQNMLCSPDEAHMDKFRHDVLYCLKRVGSYWVSIVVASGTVKTAYLVNNRSYRRLREKRWL